MTGRRTGNERRDGYWSSVEDTVDDHRVNHEDRREFIRRMSDLSAAIEAALYDREDHIEALRRMLVARGVRA
jgi:hypothetical protein